jgi:hypothetical protein
MTQQQAEQITLSSSEAVQGQPTEASFQNVTLQLAQINKWKRQGLSAQVLEDKFVFIKKYHNGKTKQYWLNLLFLNPQPEFKRIIDWRWGIASFLMILVAVLIITADNAFDLSRVFSYVVSAVILLLTGASITLLVMLQRMRNSVTFSTVNGCVPVIELTNNKPSKAAFETFISAFCQRIGQTKKSNTFNHNSLLAAEMAEHRRLHEEGVLEETHYQKAKRRLLAQHSAKKTAG